MEHPIKNSPPFLSNPTNSSLTLQLAKLHSICQQLLSNNRSKLQQIIEYQDSSFRFDLYKPTQPTKINQICRKELLLKQIDRMMEQETYLDRKIQQGMLKDEEQINKKYKLTHQYTVENQSIVDIWSKYAENKKKCLEGEGSADRIDSLNMVVVMTKKKIEEILKNEKLLQNNIKCGINEEKNHSVDSQQKAKLESQNKKLFKKIQELERIIESKDSEIETLQLQLTEQEKLKKQIKNREVQCFQLKMQKAGLSQELLLAEKQSIKLKKIQSEITERKIEGSDFSLYLQTKVQNLPDLRIEENVFDRSLEELLSFLTKEKVTKNPEKGGQSPERTSDSPYHNIQIPHLNLNISDQTPDQKHSPLETETSQQTLNRTLSTLCYTDRPTKPSLHEAKLSKFLKTSHQHQPRYTKINSTLDLTAIPNLNLSNNNLGCFEPKDENMKKFIRKSQILATERTKFVNSKNRAQLSLRTNESTQGELQKA